MPLDTSLLNGGSGLVKSHEIDGDQERTVMRSAEDISKLRQLQIDDELGCNRTARQNVVQNMFDFQVCSRVYRSY